MSRETYSLRAGGRRMDLPFGSGEAVRIESREWPGADQVAVTADGRYGAKRVRSDLGGAVTTSLIVQSDVGEVPGDADGLAINRVSGRDVQSVTKPAATAISWAADTSDQNPQSIDAAARVWVSQATTVVLEVRRNSTVISSKSLALPANTWQWIKNPAASATGTDPLSIFVRLAGSAPSGTEMRAHLPVGGVGLDCTYHDEYTPGAMSLFGGRSARPAHGPAWLEAFTAGLQQVVGAVRGADAPEIVVSFDGGDATTWNVHTAKADPQEKPQFEGWESGKLAITHEPLGTGTPRTLAGGGAVVDGAYIWTASEDVPGDDDAAAAVSCSWSTSRRAAIALAAPADPVSFAGADLDSPLAYATAVGGGDATGAINATVMRVPVYAGMPAMVDVGTIDLPPGRWHVIARMRSQAFAARSALTSYDLPVAVRINGIEQARGPVPPRDDSFPIWVPVRFGTIAVQAGQQVTLAVDTRRIDVIGTTLLIDQIDAIPADGLVGADLAGAPVSAATPVAGDGAGVSGWTGDLATGQAGGFGGTWTLTPNTAGLWSRAAYLDPIVNGVGSGLKRAAIGSVAGGAAVTAIVKWADDTGSIALTFSGGEFRISTLAGQLRLQHPATVDLDFVDLYPVDPTEFYETTLAVDEEGRWVLSIGREGDYQTTVAAGHAFAAAGGTFKAEILADSAAAGDIAVRSLALRPVSAAGGLTWSTSARSGVSGDLPFLAPATRPRIYVIGGGDITDTPLVPHPDDVGVVVTPRYLMAPR